MRRVHVKVPGGVQCDYFLLTRIANAIFHLSAFARFPALHCLSMIQGTVYLVMDSMIELNDYYQLY